MRSFLAAVSRILSRITGGSEGQTLCARIAARWGADCIFCRIIGQFTEDDHCRSELEWWLKNGHER